MPPPSGESGGEGSEGSLILDPPRQRRNPAPRPAPEPAPSNPPNSPSVAPAPAASAPAGESTETELPAPPEERAGRAEPARPHAGAILAASRRQCSLDPASREPGCHCEQTGPVSFEVVCDEGQGGAVPIWPFALFGGLGLLALAGWFAVKDQRVDLDELRNRLGGLRERLHLPGADKP